MCTFLMQYQLVAQSIITLFEAWYLFQNSFIIMPFILKKNTLNSLQSKVDPTKIQIVQQLQLLLVVLCQHLPLQTQSSKLLCQKTKQGQGTMACNCPYYLIARTLLGINCTHGKQHSSRQHLGKFGGEGKPGIVPNM